MMPFGPLPKAEKAETIPIPVSAILKVLADSIRSADTDEKRTKLADTLEQIAAAYLPFLTVK